MSREDEIRIIAYGIWEKEGRPDGKDDGHWFKATQIWEQQHQPKTILLSSPAAPAVQDKTAKKARPSERK